MLMFKQWNDFTQCFIYLFLPMDLSEFQMLFVSEILKNLHNYYPCNSLQNFGPFLFKLIILCFQIVDWFSKDIFVLLLLFLIFFSY